MTTPDNPYGDPGQNPPPPAYGQPPAYGSPQYGAPQGGQPAPYGQAPYGAGAPPAGNFGGTLAEWPVRVGAYLIDYFLPIIPAIVIVLVAIAAKAAFLAILAYVAVFGFWIWNLVQQGKTGQTIGKKYTGLYLVRESDGQFVGPGMSILRYFVHIVDSIPCIPVGLLWPLWDAKKQTFADKIMGTVVVKR